MRPYKLRIVYDVDGWAYHHNALGLQRYAPDDFEVSLVRKRGIPDPGQLLGDEPPDAVFLIERTRVSEITRRVRERDWPTAVIAAWSNGWPHRVDAFHDVYRSCDALLICNTAFWENTGRQTDTYAIPYGFDPRIFGLRVAPEERSPKVIWCGSEFHRGLKGYDEIMLPLGAHFARRGIAYDFRLVDSFGSVKASLEDMADWYNEATVLVCASSTEGTPNVALEAAACGCTIVSTPVGNMTELIEPGVNGFLVERNVEAVLAGVESAIADYPRLSHRMQADIAAFSWPLLAPRFFEMFRSEIEKKRKRISRGRRLDLSSSLTCIVLKRDGAGLSNCIATLYRQQPLVKVETLEASGDQDALWHGILDQCRTPYILLLDESMRLAPGALTALWEKWRGRKAGRYLLQDPSILERPPGIHALPNAPLMIDRDVARERAPEQRAAGRKSAQPGLYARCIAVGVPARSMPAAPRGQRFAIGEPRDGRRAAE